MKQHNSCLSPKVAGLALALFGLSAIVGVGSIGEAQAGQQALSKSFAPADRAGAYAATRVSRSPGEKKCPRSSDGCDRNPPPVCKPNAPVCRVDVDPMLKLR